MEAEKGNLQFPQCTYYMYTHAWMLNLAVVLCIVKFIYRFKVSMEIFWHI